MRLVLCSEGFYTSDTIQKCAELCGKKQEDISIAVINEAHAVQEGDKRWVLDNLNSAANNFGGEIDIIDLLALDKTEVEERIRSKDVIYVIGGDTDYLMSIFKRTGFDEILIKFLKTKVYVGSSAGSQVIGKRISGEAYRILYGEQANYDISEYLDLVDFSIIPHLDSPDFPNRKETLLEAVGEFNGKVYGLRDDSAVIVDGDKLYTIGSDPVVIKGGELQNTIQA